YDTIKGIWDSLGEMFEEGFDLKLPHISVSGGVPPYGINGMGTLPKFNVDWYANGGILTSPTIFGMQNGRFLGGGEAGAEAVLPLSNLETMIAGAMTQALGNGGDTIINVSIDNNQLGSVLLTAQQMMSLRRGK
ncbi:MAG: phage tail tape measure protein, partial [Exiguobacterium sp.]|nr:phage tail tape measure protein [Exiguobacterium sp.]